MYDREYKFDFDVGRMIMKNKFLYLVLSMIMCFSFIGEVLHYSLPFPIPASIYGIVLMFLSLIFHIIPLEKVRETGNFLVEIMPIMFIPAAVGLLDSWEIIRPSCIQYIVITVVSTVAVMAASGRLTQRIIWQATKKEEKINE